MANNKETKQNRSMFLYTALIFAVALVLIIVAFFGQKNIRELRTNTKQTAPTAAVTTADPEEETDPSTDELAITANALAAAKEENNTLKTELKKYKVLAAAYKAVTAGNTADAEAALSKLDKEALTEEQRVLYEQTEKEIIKGKEQ